MKTSQQLHHYQQKTVSYILEKKRCAVYLGMGLGKTVITLTALVQLLEEKKISRVLVIAPLRVVHNVWHTEIQKWEHTKHLTWSLVYGSAIKRLKELQSDKQIYVISRDNVRWLHKEGYTEWDAIVLDESTSFKNPSARRFKALKSFTYQYMVQLTGIPDPNGLLDLWSQIYLLDHGERLGRAFYIYRDTYFYSDYMGYKYTPKDPKVIYDRISDIAMCLKAEDYLELPARIDLVTRVNLPDYGKYKELEREYILQLQEADIVACNAAVLTGKLLQFCNGAVYDENRKAVEIHQAKLDALEELTEGNPNDNILVAYNFKSDLERLRKRFKHAMVLDHRESTVRKWNEGEIKLLLCHPASGSKGLNLQYGGNIIVWFGLTWNLEDYMQFNARLHRQGQSRPVTINHIVAADTIDETVLQMLKAKNLSHRNLLNSLTAP